MKTWVSLMLLVGVAASLVACEDGKGGASGEKPATPIESPERPPEEGSGAPGDRSPEPGIEKDCASEVLEHCDLWGLSGDELMKIRDQVVHMVPRDVIPENYPGMKIIVARVLILQDFIGTYYSHADLKPRKEMEEHYIAYFLSIKWK